MRRLAQPGPAPEERIESLCVPGIALDWALTPGDDLITALTAPLIAAGCRAGSVTFVDVALHPFRYLLPGPARDAAHVAWFSDPHDPTGDPAQATMVEYAAATFGWRDGAPFVHCHGVWTEPDGSRRGGHMLPEECRIAGPGHARGWGSAAARIVVEPDAETNFPLFHPRPIRPTRDAAPLRLILARLRPNQDLSEALATLCARHGASRATLRGSLGSLIGARFADGRTVPDPATEVLVRDGQIHDGQARLTLAVIDQTGAVHCGPLAPGENAVCITFEAMLEVQ